MKYVAITVSGKTGKRILVAKDGVRVFLKRIRERNQHTGPDDFVFRLPDGSAVRDLHGSFETMLKDLNLLHDNFGKRSLYSLRHTYATKMILNSNMDLHRLAVNMGSSVGMLEKHCSHLTPILAAREFAAFPHDQVQFQWRQLKHQSEKRK